MEDCRLALVRQLGAVLGGIFRLIVELGAAPQFIFLVIVIRNKENLEDMFRVLPDTVMLTNTSIFLLVRIQVWLIVYSACLETFYNTYKERYKLT